MAACASSYQTNSKKGVAADCSPSALPACLPACLPAYPPAWLPHPSIGLQKPHLRSRQLDHIVARQRQRGAANGGAVQHRLVGAFHMRQHKAVVAAGDGGHGHAGFANGGDHLGQFHGAPGCVAAEHLDAGADRRHGVAQGRGDGADAQAAGPR